MLRWTIEAAQASGIFSEVAVSSDDDEIHRIALSVGGVLPIVRPAEYARDESPDIEWVGHAMSHYTTDAFAILRPTSPFRTAATIRRAWEKFQNRCGDSLRAVERWRGPHPGKMWFYHNAAWTLEPVLNGKTTQAPYHSSPTQLLPPVYIQNASLEMAWTRVLSQTPSTISGTNIQPFFTEGYEGFDINTEDDWREAERIASLVTA